jgi:hypothetical protein
MRKNILLITAILSMFVFGLQLAEPAAAASLKQVDHGSYKVNGPNNYYFIYSWKTYQYKTSYIKIKVYVKFKGQKTQTMTTTLRKESKYILQIREFYNKKWAVTYYIPEKRTAAQYYWRIIRPQMVGQDVIIGGSGSGSGSSSGTVTSNAIKH